MKSTSTIALEGMRFFAHHGYYEEERTLGGEYLLDVYVDVSEPEGAQTDELAQTVNYETIYLICQREMKRPSKLLERVVDRISDRLRFQFQQLLGLRIRLQKLHPPLDGPVACSLVERSQDFRRTCSRCQKPMICYADPHCWCSGLDPVEKRLQENLTARFGGGCLCPDCLREFS